MALKMSFLRKAKNMLSTHKPSVSFCITCRNRFWQIEQTLRKNLDDNYKHRNKVEFILVDFASTDGLQEWVHGNFREELKSGYLKYYYTDAMDSWHASICKNTSHRLANNDVVVNLDCDNFTGRNGGNYVSGVMWRYGCKEMVLQMERGLGTCGRIALTKENFMKAGGYDEAMGPFWHQDRDLIYRLQGLGITYLPKGKDDEYVKAIPNERALGVFEGDPASVAAEKQKIMDMNFEISRKNLEEGRFVANAGKETIGVSAVRMFHE